MTAPDTETIPSPTPPLSLASLKERPATNKRWFAMRVTYRGEIDMRDKLIARGMQCFLPLVLKVTQVRGRRKRAWVPAAPGLLFVYTEEGPLQTFKNVEPRLQYRCYYNSEGKKKKIIVPDQQMHDFMRIYKDQGYEITPIEDDFKPGMRVRITEGPLTGMEGTFQRIKGHRYKRFIVIIDNVACISTANVKADMLEPLE